VQATVSVGSLFSIGSRQTGQFLRHIFVPRVAGPKNFILACSEK
jgi:hypothetical protein